MKKTEFQLKNRVYWNHDRFSKYEIKITELTEIGCRDQGRQFRTYEELAPIPLSEEWLLRLGFSIHSKHSFWNYILPNKWAISMWMEEEPTAGFEEKGVCYWGETYVTVRYVHQLQNIYFSVTGLELEINPREAIK